MGSSAISLPNSRNSKHNNRSKFRRTNQSLSKRREHLDIWIQFCRSKIRAVLSLDLFLRGTHNPCRSIDSSGVLCTRLAWNNTLDNSVDFSSNHYGTHNSWNNIVVQNY